MSVAMERGPQVGAHEATQAREEANGPAAALATPAALPEGRGRGSGWVAYHNVRFKFALKYPADVFAYDAGPSDENVRNLVSRDGGAKLHIFATDNGAGTTPYPLSPLAHGGALCRSGLRPDPAA